MEKAFVFDMDGVIVDTENAWELYGDSFLLKLFGKKIREKVGDVIGMTINEEYSRAVKYGFSMDKQQYIKLYDEKAKYVFSKAAITPDVNLLAEELIKMKFKIGLVSSSRRTWINYLLPRLNFGGKIDYIISVNDRTDLKPKPAPDAYLEAMKELGSIPQKTIILEDSNRGIQAAKSAG
jgi:HAD superfamily hydrolase (TIGR01509 family)